MIMPYLMIDGAAEAIDIYKNALDAVEKYRIAMPDGGIGHAEILVNGAKVLRAPEDQFYGE